MHVASMTPLRSKESTKSHRLLQVSYEVWNLILQALHSLRGLNLHRDGATTYISPAHPIASLSCLLLQWRFARLPRSTGNIARHRLDAPLPPLRARAALFRNNAAPRARFRPKLP